MTTSPTMHRIEQITKHMVRVANYQRRAWQKWETRRRAAGQ